MKKLYKSERDQILTGIIGGMGEYFDIDPTVLRIGFVVLVLITGIFPGVIAYIIAYFIIPEKPHTVSTLVTPPPMKTEPKPEVKEEAPQPGFGHSMVTPEEATVTVDDLMEPTIQEHVGGELTQAEKKENHIDEPTSPTIM
ncbi:MAG: hypothetical protein RL292_571 [Candidatus Parcubacteria bacterium]